MAINIAAIAVRRVRWQPAWRLIPSRYPAVGPWDRIADPADFDALAQLEGLTNPRLRTNPGALPGIPCERWLTGAGSTPVMAAFAHLNPEGSRFSDGRFGVFYASRALETAIRETVHHRERFLARTHEPPTVLQMRSYQCTIACALHDLRGGYPAVHDPDDYRASQRLALQLRAQNSNGVVYDSVRHRGGQCAALFWPDRVGPCRVGRHYAYHWDGSAIHDVVELRHVALE
ncbi:MAG: RES family NAD+ phosphorylase [Steroidobacteraceae bacterium]